MQVSPHDPGISPSPTPPSPARRRFGIVAFAGLTVFLCSGATSPTSCPSGNIGGGPSSGEVIGAAVGGVAVVLVGVVVAVELSKGHHTLNGCVIAGPNGLELVTTDSKRYALQGDAASIKVGDRVKIHGSRIKKTKDTQGDQIYRVEKLNKDYGPCPAALAGHPAP
jgi:hypothetical protein